MALASAEAPLHLAFADVEALLLPLVQQKLQEHGGGAAEAAQQQDARSGADLAPMMASLRKLIESHVCSAQELQVPGIPLPEVDEQLGPLQQEVEAVLQRLAGHRQQVPAVMAAALEQLMVQLRPQEQDTHDATDQDGAAAAPAESGGAAESDEQQLEAARQLHASLKAALNKLPALRARLEEVTGRLGRNLSAVDAAQAQAALPPRTVERVLLRRGVADAAADDADC